MRQVDAPPVRLLEVRAAVLETRTRIPFRYGIACLTRAPSLLVEARIDRVASGVASSGGAADDRSASTHLGRASDGLPPLWFDKDPSKDFRQNVEDQLAAFRIAREIWLDAARRPRTLAEIWLEALPRTIEACAARGLNALTASFGSSFLERALLDALTRSVGQSLFDALRHDLTGFETSTLLPARPAATVLCRHTVGLGDPIRIADVPDAERLHDDLPQALEECIDVYGLRAFKLKVRGDPSEDSERLRRLADLFAERCTGEYIVTLDGNEQYGEARGLVELLETLARTENGARLVRSIELIEQPLRRDLALADGVEEEIRSLDALRPVIIDESDDCLESFPRALELGYRGVSHKNCKGPLKSLHHRERILAARGATGAAPGSRRLIQSAEDLANLAVIPLQQDLALVTALGIPHVERNGHHYFPGLDHLPRREAESALLRHSDLYRRLGARIALRVERGEISTRSLAAAQGLGYSPDLEIAFDERTPLEDWRFTSE